MSIWWSEQCISWERLSAIAYGVVSLFWETIGQVQHGHIARDSSGASHIEHIAEREDVCAEKNITHDCQEVVAVKARTDRHRSTKLERMSHKSIKITRKHRRPPEKPPPRIWKRQQ